MPSISIDRMMRSILAALVPVLLLQASAHAGPNPEIQRPPTGRYQLFAGSVDEFSVNRVYYGVTRDGTFGNGECCDRIWGGFWPKGTGNMYMFSSGPQVAGIIAGDRATNPWAHDTTGANFYDPSGLRNHGGSVTGLNNADFSGDTANWPVAGYVPREGAAGDLFDPSLRGRLSASQGDIWFIASEVDPGRNAARPHPLGIAAEFRVMGWNYPVGNEDLFYLIITYYNVTSLNESDYAQYRPGLREILVDQAREFHRKNDSTFSITLPADGYTIDPFYAGIAADPDVSWEAGFNLGSVNLPFAMGFAWRTQFPRLADWAFAPEIFSPPFFPGTGMVGIKYLKSLSGPPAIQLFSEFTGGGLFPDANSATRLYKYLSGSISAADGISCNQGSMTITRICYLHRSFGDIRFMESSPGTILPPGGSTTMVVSYIHAAPVQIPGYVGGTEVGIGDPTILSDPTRLFNGANTIDSLAGFNGYTDANGDGIVQPREVTTIRRSLLNKAQLAQAIFDSHFLMPTPPDGPEFFLIPGNNQVTVVWSKSSTEATGDPYFALARDASVTPPGGGAPVTNPLYDPDYRQFDVEGYRIYRGRTSDPSALQLIGQFDYIGTTFSDYTGQVVTAYGEDNLRCAPELNVTTDCPDKFDPQVPGVQLVKHVDYNIGYQFRQVGLGQRVMLPNGELLNLAVDTAFSTPPDNYADTGVPFMYVDDEVRNGLRYFYVVTSFDVNSVNSTGRGNTSLESGMTPKPVTPNPPAVNLALGSSTTIRGIFGRGVELTDTVAPTISPATGIFSKREPPANDWSVQVEGLVAELLRGSGTVSIRLDSIQLGDPDNDVPHLYFLSAGDDAGRSEFTVPIRQPFTTGKGFGGAPWHGGTANPELVAAYGGGAEVTVMTGSFSMSLEGSYYYANKARGCVNGAPGFSSRFGASDRACYYNGAVWFDGASQTEADPWRNTYDHWETGLDGPPSGDLTNVGHVAGVKAFFDPEPYLNQSTRYRFLAGVLSGAYVAADTRVYWGSGGTIDSVIDVTHNVPVPFSAGIGGTWGILNQSATTAAGSYDGRPGVLTNSDFTCVPGLRDQVGVRSVWPCNAPPYLLARTAMPGTIAFGRNSDEDQQLRAPATNPGFGLYLRGHIFLLELEGNQLPAAGTVWTMRDYIGAVRGGRGAAGDFGEYKFTQIDRPFTAVGAEVVIGYDVTNRIDPSTRASLARVHTVPDPYYNGSEYESVGSERQINFVNLPVEATIRIYTTSGVLVRVLQHHSEDFGGTESWDLRNRNHRTVASGVYFYHVQAANGASAVGRMTVVLR